MPEKYAVLVLCYLQLVSSWFAFFKQSLKAHCNYLTSVYPNSWFRGLNFACRARNRRLTSLLLAWKSAPRSASILAACSWPQCEAACRGVQLSLSQAFTSMPTWISNLQSKTTALSSPGRASYSYRKSIFSKTTTNCE